MTSNAFQKKSDSLSDSSIGKKQFIIMMALIMAINALAIDIMLPAMQGIKASFHAGKGNEHQYIIFYYLLGFGISQLFFGPVSDRFGRRLPLISGLFFYSAASFACAFAPDFHTLLVLRAIQGIGAAAARVVTVSIIRDLYHGRRMAEIMSIVMMVFMIVPILAPAIGQTILLGSQWQFIFIFMAAAGLLIAFWVLLELPETISERRPLTFLSVRSGFRQILGNRTALCYTLAFSVVLGALFSSINTATQIYVGIYRLDNWFPVAYAAVAIFQVLSSFLNARLVGRLGMRRISHSMLICFIVAASIWFVWSLIDMVPFPVYMVLIIVIMFSFGAMGANFNTLAMEPLGKLAGTASAVFGFMQTIIGASLGIIAGQAFNSTTTPIAGSFVCFGLLALIFILLAEKGRLFTVQQLPETIAGKAETAERNSSIAENPHP